MLAIEMIGGVYCPLSPRDPTHRLQSLLEQIQSRSVLVHHLTKTKLQMNVISTDIDSVLATSEIKSDNDVDLLRTVLVSPNNIAYIIFTSGSTGIPKAVSNLKEHCTLIINLFLSFKGSSST
jgi:non-ribosomal peptide synthetase component F